MLRAFLLSAFLGLAAAECPNACSGHGTCGAKDSCSCYQNYQGNDCSERTCYFGIAHVDSPKGDLNADGYISGPLTTVVTGSEVYPWGTTEQYPNADANEGHFYMECSNKGICDRKSGTCDCFDGYEGTACVRASCPNDCSGHGTCESIKELAEMKAFNTNSHDTPTTSAVGATDFSAAVDESYAYNLWDQEKTMGCKCDPVYYGADCSLKKCKYGVDPLFFDNSDGVIYQTSVVHLGSQSTNAGALGGSFKLVFYDVFGERYVTKDIPATTASCTSSAVIDALQGLPNGVIAKTSTDVTNNAQTSPAVTVSVQGSSGSVNQAGNVGAGSAGTGAGMGTFGSTSVNTGSGLGTGFGPEFTVTFSTNPGMLKSIEVDTRQVSNPGSTDYWVANTRQGQFNSRYTNNLGRVETLKYGSKLLYTNTDLGSANTKAAWSGALLKIGGQELRADAWPGTGTDTALKAHMVILSEPYLGASITPVTVDMGVVATTLALNNDADSDLTLSAAHPDTIGRKALESGAKLYVNSCPMVSNSDAAASATTSLKIYKGHDCQVFSSATHVVYRRSDDPSNQNLYKTSGDTAVATDALITTRGSADVYVVSRLAANAVNTLTTVKKYDIADNDRPFTFTAAGKAIAANDYVFVNGLGPIKVTEAVADEGTVMKTSGKEGDVFFPAFDDANTKMPVHVVSDKAVTVAAGNILALNGRRYKVKAVADLGGATGGKITLTETFAGGQLQTICSSCVTAAAADGASITTAATSPVVVNLEDQVLVGGYAHGDLAMTVTAASATSTVATSAGCLRGKPTNIHTAGGTATAVTGQTADLYRVINGPGYVGSLITEHASPTTFQYVSQCSNRGTCDASTGICKCFKGYSNDNCDTQNMLAM